MKYEIVSWTPPQTEKEYPEGSLVLWVNLGEGGFGIIVLCPDGSFHLESIPQYGGEPRWEQQVISLQEGLSIVKEWT